MERISYLLLEIGAVVVGIALFAMGYTSIKGQFKGRTPRIFWTAVAVVLAFLTVTFGRAEEKSKKESQSASDTEKKESLENQAEWEKLVHLWGIVSQLRDDSKSSKELDQIGKETKNTLDALIKLTKKGLITTALITLIEKDMFQMREVRPLDVVCYGVGALISPQEISWKRLNERLPLLEKIAEEGKINYWAYKNVILRIKKDVDILEASKITNEQSETIKKIKKSLDTLLDKLTAEKLSPEDEKAVKSWIKDLGDENFQKRESATESLKALLDKTPAVIPFLREAAKGDDPEIKMRVNQILTSIGETIEPDKKPEPSDKHEKKTNPPGDKSHE